MKQLPLIAVTLIGVAFAQDEQRPATESAKPPAAAPAIRPYDKVITKDAQSQPGLFRVHKLNSKYYFEIPASELGKEMLMVVSFKSNSTGLGYGGTEIANRVVAWERVEDRVLLRDVAYQIAADPNDPISRAVKASSERTIIMSFNVAANAPDGGPVIDVTRLFSTEVPEFSARRQVGARGFDASRSFIERIRAFPTNINVEAAQTYTAPDSGSGPGGSGAPLPGRSQGSRMQPGTNATIVAAYSMVKLPENPMKPRLFDDRLGFFNVRQVDYSSPKHRVTERRYIARWRLEKKDPKAAVSEPVKPIVYYIDPATPAKWVPYVKKGVEDWQPAFEAAGFKNAIQARDVPADDPNFSLEDARISSVRWLASDIRNAYGPSIKDPRTGEILESDIKMYHNILALQRDWYFTQVGHLDKRAQKMPMPDDLMGELIRYVVAHEVGHTLGFPHNFKASGMYTVAQVRDKNWVKKMGHTPTLMDYSRFNYVAQPEDGIPVEDLIPKIGPYDMYAVKWGYAPIDDAATAEAELPKLREWLKAQETSPWLRFSMPATGGIDPTDQTEAVADSDPVLATTLGTKNLKRILDLVPNAYPESGESFEDMRDLYSAVIGQWRRELGHVAVVIGGLETQNKHLGQQGAIYVPISKERQQAALKFLSEQVLQTPKWILRPDITSRTEPQGSLARVLGVQRGLLNAMLAPAKLQRMMEMEAALGTKAYTPREYLGDLYGAVFTELSTTGAAVDPYRRNLQRAYLEILDERLNRPASGETARGPMGGSSIEMSPVDDTRSLLREQLRTIAETQLTAPHYRDLADRARQILDPRFPPPSSSQRGGGGPSAEWEVCWPEAFPF